MNSMRLAAAGSAADAAYGEIVLERFAGRLGDRGRG